MPDLGIRCGSAFSTRCVESLESGFRCGSACRTPDPPNTPLRGYAVLGQKYFRDVQADRKKPSKNFRDVQAGRKNPSKIYSRRPGGRRRRVCEIFTKKFAKSFATPQITTQRRRYVCTSVITYVRAHANSTYVRTYDIHANVRCECYVRTDPSTQQLGASCFPKDILESCAPDLHRTSLCKNKVTKRPTRIEKTNENEPTKRTKNLRKQTSSTPFAGRQLPRNKNK